MKLYITKPPQPEQMWQVELEQLDNGVSIKVDGWYIAFLSNKGTLVRHGAVPRDIGFQVDDHGYVKTEKDLDTICT